MHEDDFPLFRICTQIPTSTPYLQDIRSSAVLRSFKSRQKLDFHAQSQSRSIVVEDTTPKHEIKADQQQLKTCADRAMRRHYRMISTRHWFCLKSPLAGSTQQRQSDFNLDVMNDSYVNHYGKFQKSAGFYKL